MPLRTEPEFWKTWKEFELTHGNEDTLREMLRIKRSVQATYNTKVSFMASHLAATQEQAKDPMQAMESAVTAEETSKVAGGKHPLIIFKSAGVVHQPGSNAGRDGSKALNGSAAANSNPEAINIDLPMDDDDDGDIDNVAPEDDEGMEDEEAKVIEDVDEEANSRK
ncbi:unnamed protein product [Rodentolepis nana]|uniref:BSD domain-containing protein n=1 Tax=Rodentolepis nana TaxID=102285 RepID=A0A0R3THZ8_RODNA|nr:unnamed protein product [Rodentolepis nana]